MTTVTQLGQAQGLTAAASLALTVTANAPIGSTVVVLVADGNNSARISSVTDSQGNTYTAGNAIAANASAGELKPFWCIGLTTALASGVDAITAHYSPNANDRNLVAAVVSGTGP